MRSQLLTSERRRWLLRHRDFLMLVAIGIGVAANFVVGILTLKGG